MPPTLKHKRMQNHILYLLLQLTVIQGDISTVEADAIVHPTNASFYLGGEVGMYCMFLETISIHCFLQFALKSQPFSV